MAQYQGHKNWNHWNVSLWIANEEPLYRQARFYVAFGGTRDQAAKKLLAYLLECYPDGKTPDGAPWTFSSVRAALTNWEK